MIELVGLGVLATLIPAGLIARCLGYRAEDAARLEEEAAERARMYGKLASYKF